MTTRFNIKKGNLIYWFLFFLILSIALALRLYRLGVPSLWWDEMGQVLAVRESLINTLYSAQQHHGAAPIDYLITFFVVRVNQADFILRLPAAIWGVLSVYWLYRIGKLIYSREIGMIAALLLAINPFHIRYSQELRFYSLFILLMLISSEVAWRSYHTRVKKGWILYAVLATLMLYTHYFGAFVIILHGIGILLACLEKRSMAHEKSFCLKREMGYYIVAAGAAVILFLPWFFYDALNETGLPRASVPNLELAIFRNTLYSFSGNVDVYWFVWLAFAIIGLLVTYQRSKVLGILFAVWLVVPIFFIILLDQNKSYFYNPRQYIFVLPLYLLLVGVGITEISKRVADMLRQLFGKSISGQKIAILVVVPFIVLTFFPLKNYYVYQDRRENWKEMIVIVRNNIQEGDVVLFAENAPRITYYLPPSLRARLRKIMTIEQLEAIYDSGQPVWLLTSPVFDRERFEPYHDWLNKRKTFGMPLGTGLKLYFFQKGMDANFIDERIVSMHLPNRPDVWAFYGDTVRQFQRWQIALHAHEMAASLAFDSDEKAKYLMEAGYDATFAGDIDRALADLNQAEALNPTDPEIAIRKGMALLKGDRPEDAIEILEYARDELDGDGFWSFFFLGNAYRRTGQYHKAIDAHNQALAVRAEAHDVRFFIAESYKELGEDGLARQWYQDYLDHAPDGGFSKSARMFLKQNGGAQ